MTELLLGKGKEIRALSENLYKYDYLDADEIALIMDGKKLDKQEVREYDPKL